MNITNRKVRYFGISLVYLIQNGICWDLSMTIWPMLLNKKWPFHISEENCRTHFFNGSWDHIITFSLNNKWLVLFYLRWNKFKNLPVARNLTIILEGQYSSTFFVSLDTPPFLINFLPSHDYKVPFLHNFVSSMFDAKTPSNYLGNTCSHFIQLSKPRFGACKEVITSWGRAIYAMETSVTQGFIVLVGFPDSPKRSEV